jgi:hypothetical protein
MRDSEHETRAGGRTKPVMREALSTGNGLAFKSMFLSISRNRVFFISSIMSPVTDPPAPLRHFYYHILQLIPYTGRWKAVQARTAL